MSRIEKYTQYFMAQALGELLNQRGATNIARVISPVQQVVEQVKSEIRQNNQQGQIKQAAEASTNHNCESPRKRRTPAWKLVGREGEEKISRDMPNDQYIPSLNISQTPDNAQLIDYSPV